jgi:hypothetical protein
MEERKTLGQSEIENYFHIELAAKTTIEFLRLWVRYSPDLQLQSSRNRIIRQSYWKQIEKRWLLKSEENLAIAVP